MSNLKDSRRPSRWAHRRDAIAIALLSPLPLQLGVSLRRRVYRSLFGRLGDAAYIQPGAEFIRMAGLEFGHRVKIMRDVRLDCNNQTSKICLKDDVCLDRGVDIKAQQDSQITIGEATYIGPYTCLAGPGAITIGKDCLIASHSGFYANSHLFGDRHYPIRKQGITMQGIVVEDDCFLGTGVKVLDGVTIGRGSIVGAGAIVTKSIPPYSIAVGIPAKVIAQRGELSAPTAEEVAVLTGQA